MDYVSEIDWRPVIGDPSFMGWFTVAAYAMVAILAAFVWLRKRESIWLVVAAGMAALSANKAFDLQSLFTAIGGAVAHHQGWYEQRREFQKWILLGFLSGFAVIVSWFALRHDTFWVRHKLLSVGVIFLVTFIVVRAISFGPFDVFLGSRLLGVKMNWFLELGGICLVGFSAIRARR